MEPTWDKNGAKNQPKISQKIIRKIRSKNEGFQEVRDFPSKVQAAEPKPQGGDIGGGFVTCLLVNW